MGDLPCLSHLRSFSSDLTVIIGENLLTSFLSFTFKPKILQSLISLQLTTWFCHDSKRDQYAPINALLKSLHFPQLLIFVSLSIQHDDTYLVNVFKWIRILHVGHMYVFFPCCKHLQGPSKAQIIVYISLINKGLRQLSFSVTACIIIGCDNSSIHLSYLFISFIAFTACQSVGHIW